MQRYEVFSIYDVKAKAYGAPFIAINSDLAVRFFVDLLKTPGESAWSNYPQDFCLYHIGSFDNGSARLDSSQPRLIALGSSLLPGGSVLPQTSSCPVETPIFPVDSSQPKKTWSDRIKGIFCLSKSRGE